MSRLVNEYGEPIDEDYGEGVVSLDERTPYEVSEVICVRCCERWISVRPQKTLLKDIECPNCGKGYVIKTGEEMQDDN